MMNIIFDFDGTLVDSFDEAVSIFNLLADKFHFKKAERDEIAILKDLTSLEAIKHLQLPVYKIPRVLLSARKLIRDKMPMLLPTANIKQVLHQLNDSGFTLGILTSNSIENVTIWLKQHKIFELFSFIDNESSFFGKSGKLKKLLKARKIARADAFYIGDETRDIDAAKHCKIASIAVTWGFNSEKILTQSEPDFLARKAEDLLEIFRVV
ncbi:MAG: HAD hydrolase-like protein [Gammaproteobacteria bacterium]|nr:HAD hydrolase-like protein [Gammaproteobacteria bacterium]